MKNKLPPISFPFPLDSQKHPFDMNAKGRYFIYASGFSFLAENPEHLSLNGPCFHKIKEVIPMGYKTISVNERVAFIMDGEILKEEMEVPDQNETREIFKDRSDGYTIYSNTKIYFKKYDAFADKLSKNDNWGYWDTIWESKQDAVNHAITVSEQDRGLNLLLVCRVLDSMNWH
ncbi:hypothetical protein A8F94_12175 [Bacillus sp. FJAT-27225]|uniref:hypothetical protein n=1 Tax=Bacillus sp. FJAT-27225 TaxID=1743144 RepID=UPI00080C2B70|nr:hypothetical protein [Bacillus sp. FJAT-27225]OCA85631.1 hypothetical protein A8F94_12175 [Bacillus sp. FJAT-27225]